MKQTGFKTKYSSLSRRIGFKRSPFFSMKKSSFKKFKPLTSKQTLDNLVSKCVRLMAADKEGFAQCVTCKLFFFWTEMDCGHFQKRANTTTRYDLKNLGPQCKNCNRHNGGENELFAEFVDKHHGAGTADILRAKARQEERYYPFEEEIKKWKEIYQKLVAERGNQINY